MKKEYQKPRIDIWELMTENALCASIVKAHGGVIKAIINPKGKGMTFRFSLDIEEAEYE